MNPNLSLFARTAAPGHPMAPGRAPMPSALGRAAAMGRGGDQLLAHMTPGEIAVPPQVQTPEVLTALNKAFTSAGADPTSFQAGSPDQKINPATGMPEFGFFDVMLPTILAIAGSAFLGPEVGALMAPALGLEAGGATAGLLGGALAGAGGSTIGNVLTGKPLGQSLALGAGSGIGSALGGALLGGGGNLGELFGSGPSPMAAVGPSASPPIPSAPPLPNAFDQGLPIGPAGGFPPIPDAPALPAAKGLFGGFNLRQTAGAGLGGMLGSNLAESFFPQPQLKPDLGPPMTPLSSLPPLSASIGGGSPSLSGPLNAGAPSFPTSDYLRQYGQVPQYNFFPIR